MHIHGNSWIFMDIHRYPWIPMDIHGYPWISLGFHESPWITWITMAGLNSASIIELCCFLRFVCVQKETCCTCSIFSNFWKSRDSESNKPKRCGQITGSISSNCRGTTAELENETPQSMLCLTSGFSKIRCFTSSEMTKFRMPRDVYYKNNIGISGPQ